MTQLQVSLRALAPARGPWGPLLPTPPQARSWRKGRERRGKGEESGHPEKNKLVWETASGEAWGRRGKGASGAGEPGSRGWGGGKAGGRGWEGSGPGAAGDRWVDTKSRAAGKTDGWGREEGRLEGQWLEALMRLELGWGCGEVSGEERRKRRPPRETKAERPGGQGGRGPGPAAGKGGLLAGLAAEGVTDCVVHQSGDPLSPSRGTRRGDGERQTDRASVGAIKEVEEGPRRAAASRPH